MKKNYFLLSVKQGLLALAFTVLMGTLNSQTTYTFNYTGSSQTLALAGGSYSIQCWGANGGSSNGGKGGYATGSISVSSPTIAYIYVGGLGTAVNTTGSGNALGGWNGGGNGSCNSTYGTSGGGGGGSDVRMTQNTTYANRIIVAGAGGGGSVPGQYGYVGGNGGGTTGANGAAYGSYWIGQGGTQIAGGTGTTESNSTVGAGALGVGGNHSSTLPASGWTGCGGGGGYYGGSAGGAVHSSGGGGSSYIGGVSSGTTIIFGQSGFIANPDISGNGFVRIIELCNFTLAASNSTLVNSTNPSICSGQSLTLTTSAISNYSWSTGATSSSLVVAPTTNTVYSLTALSPSNCTTTRFISVIVSPGQPTLSVVSSTNQTCLGKTATLTASGAVTYTWSNNVINGVSFTPSVTNTYTVIGQNGCGTGSAVTTITVAPLSVTMLATPTVVCAGSTSSITTVSAGTNFTWSPVPNSSSSLIVSPQVNTTYTVVVSDGTCSGTASVSVSTIPIPTIAITPALSNVCSGNSVTLTATGGTSYTWSANNATIVGNSSLQVVVPNAPTGYNVVGINSVGCTSGAAAAVITNPSPTLALSANPGFICANDPVSISVSGASTYVWDSGATTTSINVNPSVTTVYTVTGNALGCLTTETIEVTVFIPTIGISGTSSVCSGGVASVNSSSASSYAWTNGFTSQGFTIIPSATTIYSLSALTTSSGINCPSSASFQVLVVPKPVVVASAQRTVMCKNENNTISVTGANTYSWSTGQTTSSFVITPTLITNTNLVCTGISNAGCSATSTVTVKINACTGINQISNLENTFIVYPNPNSGEFTIRANENTKVNLFNSLGQKINTFDLNLSNNFEQQINGLSKGIYFISANGNEQLKQKVLVQ